MRWSGPNMQHCLFKRPPDLTSRPSMYNTHTHFSNFTTTKQYIYFGSQRVWDGIDSTKQGNFKKISFFFCGVAKLDSSSSFIDFSIDSTTWRSIESCSVDKKSSSAGCPDERDATSGSPFSYPEFPQLWLWYDHMWKRPYLHRNIWALHDELCIMADVIVLPTLNFRTREDEISFLLLCGWKPVLQNVIFQQRK